MPRLQRLTVLGLQTPALTRWVEVSELFAGGAGCSWICVVMVAPGEDTVFVMLLMVRGLRLGAAAGAGAGTHGAGALVPPADGFGRVVEGFDLVMAILFVGAFSFGVGACGIGVFRVMVPPPCGDGRGLEGGEEKHGAQRENESLHREIPFERF